MGVTRHRQYTHIEQRDTHAILIQANIAVRPPVGKEAHSNNNVKLHLCPARELVLHDGSVAVVLVSGDSSMDSDNCVLLYPRLPWT
jgi:hypothetical protein